MTIKALASRGATKSEIARLLGVTEGAVRYQVKRFDSGQTDGRARQNFKAEAVAAVIDQWRVSQGTVRSIWPPCMSGCGVNTATPVA